MGSLMEPSLSLELLQADHLCVLTGVLCLIGLIMGFLNHFESSCFGEHLYKHTAYWNFTLFDGNRGLAEGLFHKHIDGFMI